MKSVLALALSMVLMVGGVAWMNYAPAAEATDPAQGTYHLTGLPGTYTTWRPTAVSVNSAATISGMSSASVVYEVLAQGSEPSVSMIFNGIWEMPVVGPVAPASDILWQLAMPQNAILVQNDWNIYAENLLNCYAYQPIDAQIEGTLAFSYNNGGDALRPNEYCWYIDNVHAYQVLESYGISGEGESSPLFTFGENTTAQEAASGIWIQYSSITGTNFTYDAAQSRWMMSTGLTGTQIDPNTEQAVGFDNVFVLHADASVKDDGYTREYDLTEGTGIYLTKGTWQKITWYKGEATDLLVVFDANGDVLTVNPGTSYIGIYGGFAGQTINLSTASGGVGDTVFAQSAE